MHLEIKGIIGKKLSMQSHIVSTNNNGFNDNI